jgi:formylglycine-generating enzyme required for sulfatase activity
VLAAGVRPLPEYELVRRLGRGGFGEVWRARGPGGFEVALKFVRLGEQAGTVELRALELMKGVRHGNLLPMFGAWQRDDLLIVAMELADRTLLDRLREALRQGLVGIPGDELLEYLREAAKGLDHLNTYRDAAGTAAGIQHKDVKPQNLLLVGGTVKVADFGLAKLLAHTMTSAGAGMTPGYAAPEFFRWQASRWSDQYSLAVSYCQLRGGRLPFDGSPAEVMIGHLLHPPDLSMVPEVERAAVARALAKEPAQRWPSCRAFVAALQAAATGPAPLPAPAPVGQTAPKRPAPLDCTGEDGISAADVRKAQEAWARYLGRKVEEEVEIAPGVTMTFVLVPPGTFRMGSPADEKERDDDEALHTVTLTEPFDLGKYEVTQAQYRALTGKDPSHFKGDNLPVETVSWEEARDYAEQLTKKRGDKHLYRLPTEAEWEYSCRGGRSSSQPFGIGDGRALSSKEANFDGNYPYGGAAEGKYLGKTCKVGSYTANALGLCDMHGNVWEWCADCYGPYPPGDVSNPPGPAGGPNRVFRGGCWDRDAGYCRAAYRSRSGPGDRFQRLGFRLARSVPSGGK